jgi:hypothetical protein
METKKNLTILQRHNSTDFFRITKLIDALKDDLRERVGISFESRKQTAVSSTDLIAGLATENTKRTEST